MSGLELELEPLAGQEESEDRRHFWEEMQREEISSARPTETPFFPLWEMVVAPFKSQ